MRILLVTPEVRRGGGEKMVLALHKGLSVRGIESRVAVILGEVADIPNVIGLRGRHAKDLLVVGRLRKLIREWKPDWIHAHMSPAQILVVLATRGLSCNLMTTEHSTSNKRRSLPGGWIFDRWLFSYYQRICCISEAVASSFSSWMPVYNGRLRCILNGVDIRQIRMKEEPPSKLHFVSVGRLEKVKNFEVALRALGICRDSVLFSYTIFGEGSLKEELVSLAKELGLADRVCFAGWSDQLDSDICNYSALLVPSRWEGFGLVAVEGMAAGLPVLCSDVPGLADVVGDTGGAKFANNSPEDLCRLVRWVGTMEPDLARVHRRAARSRAAEFTIEKTICKYIDEYQRKYSV
jgi:glycosyltransferase involved in cell wall biosynthesis